jgi:hypothetical protein
VQFTAKHANYTFRNEATSIMIAIAKIPGEKKLQLATFRRQLHPEPLSQCCEAKNVKSSSILAGLKPDKFWRLSVL